MRQWHLNLPPVTDQTQGLTPVWTLRSPDDTNARKIPDPNVRVDEALGTSWDVAYTVSGTAKKILNKAFLQKLIVIELQICCLNVVCETSHKILFVYLLHLEFNQFFFLFRNE